MKIAITGTIGAGKSQVSKYLKRKGYPVYDADTLVHTYYEYKGKLYDAIIDLLGNQILNDDETIDRSKVAAIVFENETLLNSLETLVFPTVSEHMKSIYAEQEGLVFFEVPMLFEAQLEKDFDKIVMINAPQSLRYTRLIDRGMRLEDIHKRVSRHADEKFKIEHSDYLVINDDNIDSLHIKIDELLVKLEQEDTHGTLSN